MEVRMKQIGEIAVDSGRIVVGDPCYTTAHPEHTVTVSHGGDGFYPVVELDINGTTYLAVQIIHGWCERGLTVHKPGHLLRDEAEPALTIEGPTLAELRAAIANGNHLRDSFR